MINLARNGGLITLQKLYLYFLNKGKKGHNIFFAEKNDAKQNLSPIHITECKEVTFSVQIKLKCSILCA